MTEKKTCVCVLQCMHVDHTCTETNGGQKKVPESLEPESHMVVSCHGSARN